MTKELLNTNELISFIDKKIDRLYDRLEDLTSLGRKEECAELNSEISMWRGKRIELSELQEQLVNEQIKEIKA